MNKESCLVCNYDLLIGEHYVKTKKNETLCENCFFDRALSELKAMSHQYGFEDEEIEIGGMNLEFRAWDKENDTQLTWEQLKSETDLITNFKNETARKMIEIGNKEKVDAGHNFKEDTRRKLEELLKDPKKNASSIELCRKILESDLPF